MRQWRLSGRVVSGGVTECGIGKWLCLTAFHWTHNLRIYAGVRPWRFGLWAPAVVVLPYGLMKSWRLAQTPDPFPGRDDHLKGRANVLRKSG